MKPIAHGGRSLIDEIESRIHRRTADLYKQRRPQSSVPVGYLDNELWFACCREARAEIDP
jgi:hypothetical protein